MADKTIYKLHADVCKALAHPIRIEIIDVMQYSEMNFGQISEKIGVAKSSLSQHLSIMVEKGILKQRKKGLYTFFTLSTPKVVQACQLMREVLIEKLHKNNDILNKL